MPSEALKRWHGQRAADLDQLFVAHARMGGTGAGRRYATEQLDHAIVVAISAQFQGFCRDLHEDGRRAVVAGIAPSLQSLVTMSLQSGLQLDRGNAHKSSIGSDFGRFTPDFWDLVGERQPVRTKSRRLRLRQLNVWRNAIVHNDFAFTAGDRATITGTKPQLSAARSWRRACDQLAAQFDEVLADVLRQVLGSAPW